MKGHNENEKKKRPLSEGVLTVGGESMRRFICLLLCVALCGCFASCSDEPEEVALSEDNISEYVSVEVTFGEVDVSDNASTIHSEKYYLTSLATITVKPKGDYIFTNAFVSCVLDEGGKWKAIKSGSTDAVDLLSDWSGSISLDKEGYGKTTVSLFCYSNIYDKMHPSSAKWECYAASATGTVTQN